MAKILAFKRGSRWVAVRYYGESGFGRHGYWCEDAGGGWGVSSHSAEAAMDQCGALRYYKSKMAAIENAESDNWPLALGAGNA